MTTSWTPLPIEQGGTGGTTPLSARRALGLQVPTGGAANVNFLPAGAGAVAESVQTNLRRVIYAAQFMVGDGVTNDTAGWLNFKSACMTAGIPGLLDGKTYLIDAFSFSGNSGLKLRGYVNNPNAAQVGGHAQTVLKLRSATATFVTVDGVYDLDIQDVHFDGNQFADTVMYFPGLNAVTDNMFERCSFDGATPITGRTFYYTGIIQVDNTRFRYCNIGQVLGGNGSVYAGRLIETTNTNAFNIWYEHCHFEDSDYLFVFGAGSCSFFRCDFFRPHTKFFYISSTTQPFSITDCYTEQTPGVQFFFQAGTAGVTSSYPITIERCVLNSTNDIALNCQQPVRILGTFCGGNIDVTPLATFGTQYVYAEDIGFAAGKGWTGTGYPSKVVSINETRNQVSQVALFGPGLNAAGRVADAQGAVVASANNLILGTDGNYFQISGNTQINLLANTGWQGGSVITLKFNSTPTVKHNQATSGTNVKIILNGAVDFVAAANNTLTLRYDSTDVAWYEQSRKV